MGAAPAPDCGGPFSGSSIGARCAQEQVDALTEFALTSGDGCADRRSKGSQWPPGFRFHPTDEELVLYYLKRKICRRRFRFPMIADIDVYKLDPWDLPDKSLLRRGDRQWFFFSPRDKKYPNGSRSNRATKNGYWKATGKDRTICHNSRTVGNKKTLVYHHGRPLKGKRTDWVMHEYTMDENVVMRDNNLQDSYALYKLFCKSGPGPKNGEQYGATFREEEWDDDDDAVDGSLQNLNNREAPILEQTNVDSVASTLGDNGDTLPIDDLEDLLLKMSNEQDVIQQQSEVSAFVSKVDFGAEVGSCHGPHLESTSVEHCSTWCMLSNVDMGFQIDQLDSTDPQPIEVSQVTFSSNCIEQGQLRAGEEFLEIEDFDNPETGVWSMGEAGIREPAEDTNGFHDLDEYFDASMFIAEALGPLDGATTNSYFGGFCDDGAQNQACNITTELWTHEQTLNVWPAELNQVAMASSSSGVVYAGNQPNSGEQTLGQLDHVRGASDSLFSSALSALLDSIPSRPALASENALISRALERVSSFGAGQIGARNQNTATGGHADVGRRGQNRGGNFLFVSLLVGLCAIIWVLTIGTAVKVIKGLWARFISS